MALRLALDRATEEALLFLLLQQPLETLIQILLLFWGVVEQPALLLPRRAGMEVWAVEFEEPAAPAEQPQALLEELPAT